MKEIFQEYGPAIITFVVVLLIVAIMYTLTNGQDAVAASLSMEYLRAVPWKLAKISSCEAE